MSPPCHRHVPRRKVLTLHVIGFVATWFIMISYLIFIMRPYLREASNETRRIAELLTQLPSDVDVEGLLRFSLGSASIRASGKCESGR